MAERASHLERRAGSGSDSTWSPGALLDGSRPRAADRPCSTRLWRILSKRPGMPAPPLCVPPGLPATAMEQLLYLRQRIDLDAELQRLAQAGIHLLTWGTPDYPHLLREIDQPPPVLYVRGELTAGRRVCGGHCGHAQRHQSTARGRPATGRRPGGERRDRCQRPGAGHRRAWRIARRWMPAAARWPCMGCGLDDRLSRATPRAGRCGDHSGRARCRTILWAHASKPATFRRAIASSAACRWGRWWWKPDERAAR